MVGLIIFATINFIFLSGTILMFIYFPSREEVKFEDAFKSLIYLLLLFITVILTFHASIKETRHYKELWLKALAEQSEQESEHLDLMSKYLDLASNNNQVEKEQE